MRVWGALSTQSEELRVWEGDLMPPYHHKEGVAAPEVRPGGGSITCLHPKREFRLFSKPVGQRENPTGVFSRNPSFTGGSPAAGATAPKGVLFLNNWFHARFQHLNISKKDWLI